MAHPSSPLRYAVKVGAPRAGPRLPQHSPMPKSALSVLYRGQGEVGDKGKEGETEERDREGHIHEDGEMGTETHGEMRRAGAQK